VDQFGNFNACSIAWKRGSLRSGSRRGSAFNQRSSGTRSRVVIERIQYDGPAGGGNACIYDGPASGVNACISVTRQYGKPAVPYEYLRIAGRKRNGAL
jgi:hypothetical protein